MMKALLSCALEELEQGRPVVLASIAASRGSTPRSIGAVMAVGAKGHLAGTIGGGELEFKCSQMALNPHAPLIEFTLNNQQAATLGMICGGSAQVLFTPLQDPIILRQALYWLEEMRQGAVLLPLDGGEPVLVDREDVGFSSCPILIEYEGKQCLSLPLMEPGRIFLMGGGHVALELSRLLDQLHYPYLIVDDRTEFASAERFPNAQRRFQSDFSGLSGILTGHFLPGGQDCICVMTRGHLADMDALRFSLTTSAGYIGLMGSRRKREQMFAQLRSDGFTDAPQRIVTPIGLDIGGQTPAEIAVSIAAQLIQRRSQHKF